MIMFEGTTGAWHKHGPARYRGLAPFSLELPRHPLSLSAMQHEIIGTTMPVLNISLGDGERVVAVSGELSWMSSSIQMNTTTGAAGGGGLFGALKRVIGGGSLFMTEYRAEGSAGTVAFATKLP